MFITVTYPSIIGDMLERKSEQATLPEGAPEEDLFRHLTVNDDTTDSILKQTRPFINGQQAERANTVQEGAEAIVIRPVAGG